LDLDGTFANSIIELSAHTKNVGRLRYFKA
jgi:hypothetical protein